MVRNVEVVPVVGNQVSCGAKPGVGDVSLGCPICTSKLRTGSLRVSLFPCRLFCRGGFKSVAYRLSGRVCQFLFLEVSLSGSQTNSFIFNVSPTEHASCRTTRTPRLFCKFTRISLSLSPRVPPVSPQCSVQEQARPLRWRRDLVEPAVSLRPGATWAKRVPTAAQPTRTPRAPTCQDGALSACTESEQ